MLGTSIGGMDTGGRVAQSHKMCEFQRVDSGWGGGVGHNGLNQGNTHRGMERREWVELEGILNPLVSGRGCFKRRLQWDSKLYSAHAFMQRQNMYVGQGQTQGHKCRACAAPNSKSCVGPWTGLHAQVSEPPLPIMFRNKPSSRKTGWAPRGPRATGSVPRRVQLGAGLLPLPNPAWPSAPSGTRVPQHCA